MNASTRWRVLWKRSVGRPASAPSLCGRPRSATLLVTTALLLGFDGLTGQGQAGALSSIQEGQTRVVFPSDALIDSALAARLIHTVRNQPGFPFPLSRDGMITISLASAPRPGILAWSSATRRLIVLPLVDVYGWSDSLLDRVIRHELTHLAIDNLPGFQRAPLWFREGMAEWTAGGLTCEGEARVRLYILQRPEGLLALPLSDSDAQTRVAYDLYTTLFKYLAQEEAAVLPYNILLHTQEAASFDDAIRAALGRDLRDVIRDWGAWLRRTYHGIDTTCVPA